jgi:hypothetical protein
MTGAVVFGGVGAGAVAVGAGGEIGAAVLVAQKAASSNASPIAGDPVHCRPAVRGEEVNAVQRSIVPQWF